jgi:flavin-dependent dehydrogenase
MAKRYDLIVVGGGPGGLMAAKTAAEDGLKVLLLEQKNNPSRINRSCLQIFYLEWVCPDGYIETVKAEVSQEKTKFIFPGPGFSIDYTGILRPYTNAIWISPSEYKVSPFKNKLFGFYYDKEAFLAGLLTEAEKAGVEVMTGTPAMVAENTSDGVKVFARAKSVEKTFEAKKAVAADGVMSKIVESLGLNEKRKVFLQIPGGGGTSCVVDGMECDIPGHETAWLSLNIPTIGKTGIGLMGEQGKFMHYESIETLSKIPRYAKWFRNITVAKTKRMGMGAITVRTPLRDPVAGNVVAIGDAAAPVEVWIQGAVACGYQVAKATVKELNGQSGYTEYTKWWQKAVYCNSPGYFKRIVTHHLIDQICSDEDVDYIFKLFQDKSVVPTLELARNPEIISKDNPALYEKMTKGLEQVMKQIEPVLATYPPGSDVFEPDAYLKRWRPYIVPDINLK